MSKAMIDIVLCPCEVYTLELESFDRLGCCPLISLWARAPEVVVTFRWRHWRPLGGNRLFFMWGAVVSVCEDLQNPSNLEKLHSVQNIKVNRRVWWWWRDFVTQTLTFGWSESLCGSPTHTPWPGPYLDETPTWTRGCDLATDSTGYIKSSRVCPLYP